MFIQITCKRSFIYTETDKKLTSDYRVEHFPYYALDNILGIFFTLITAIYTDPQIRFRVVYKKKSNA